MDPTARFESLVKDLTPGLTAVCVLGPAPRHNVLLASGEYTSMEIDRDVIVRVASEAAALFPNSDTPPPSFDLSGTRYIVCTARRGTVAGLAADTGDGNAGGMGAAIAALPGWHGGALCAHFRSPTTLPCALEQVDALLNSLRA